MIGTGSNGTTDMQRTSNGQAADATTRILVVDDEEAITDLVATTLRYEGFTVETAASGREALATMMEDGTLRVTCEFCKSEYVYDAAALDALVGGEPRI